MKSIAIITARGGSKRIPKKNIKNFLGKPILAYPIQAALDSKLFDEVMVSTDSEEIADVAKKYGASVPFLRSAKTSDDFATTADVLYEVISEYKKRGQNFETMCCLYPTAPFVTAKKLKAAHQKFLESQTDTLLPVVAFSYPPQRAFVMRDNTLQVCSPEDFAKRSQDLEPIYHDVGQFYFHKVEKFYLSYRDKMNNRPRGGDTTKIIPFILDEMEVQDIDNLSDWKLAELKFQVLQENGAL